MVTMEDDLAKSTEYETKTAIWGVRVLLMFPPKRRNPKPRSLNPNL